MTDPYRPCRTYTDQPAPTFSFENIDAVEFARRLNLPLSWVRNHTRRHCPDPIPHVKLAAKVIFEWGSPSGVRDPPC